MPRAQRTSVMDTLSALSDDGREKNIDKILDDFQKAFVFYPCTGAEYKAMQEKGLE